MRMNRKYFDVEVKVYQPHRTMSMPDAYLENIVHRYGVINTDGVIYDYKDITDKVPTNMDYDFYETWRKMYFKKYKHENKRFAYYQGNHTIIFFGWAHKNHLP